MNNKLMSILLLIVFWAVILHPLLPFAHYYLNLNKERVESVVNKNHCDSLQDKEIAKMASNGDAYLRALIKRVCDKQKTKVPKLPAFNFSVFVITLYNEKSYTYEFSERNFSKISTFIVQPSLSSYIQELLKPPQLS